MRNKRGRKEKHVSCRLLFLFLYLCRGLSSAVTSARVCPPVNSPLYCRSCLILLCAFSCFPTVTHSQSHLHK